MTAHTHESWQAEIIELATITGWKHLHVRKSIGRRNGSKAWQTTTNRKGWPDLLFWAPGRGFVAVEVKVHPDKPTADQLAVLAELEAAGAKTFVWWPEDLEAACQTLSRRSVTTGVEE